MSFSLNDRVVMAQQCFEDVLAGDKGTVIGFDSDRDLVIVEFDYHRGEKYYTDPKLLRLINYD